MNYFKTALSVAVGAFLERRGRAFKAGRVVASDNTCVLSTGKGNVNLMHAPPPGALSAHILP
jgi:hypothetical protein